jgi:hypothetical protein
VLSLCQALAVVASREEKDRSVDASLCESAVLCLTGSLPLAGRYLPSAGSADSGDGDPTSETEALAAAACDAALGVLGAATASTDTVAADGTVERCGSRIRDALLAADGGALPRLLVGFLSAPPAAKLPSSGAEGAEGAEGAKASEGRNEDALDPSLGGPEGLLGLQLRASALRALGNCCHRHRGWQDAVHDAGGLSAALGHTALNETLPVLREWALLAVRNLCEGNERNQSFVERLRMEQGAAGAVQTPELKAMGLAVETDPRTGKPRVRPQSRANAGPADGPGPCGLAARAQAAATSSEALRAWLEGGGLARFRTGPAADAAGAVSEPPRALALATERLSAALLEYEATAPLGTAHEDRTRQVLGVAAAALESAEFHARWRQRLGAEGDIARAVDEAARGKRACPQSGGASSPPGARARGLAAWIEALARSRRRG